MERQPPRITTDEIDLYIRTFYSLLRSSGPVRVRSFEEAHSYSNSSLHPGARGRTPDIAAFAYAAARLPDCMADVTKVILGQSHEHFEAASHDVRNWQRVRTRGRRRPLRWDGGQNLAVFITSKSDIDDLIPILTAYQIEWNKMHYLLANMTDASDLPTLLGVEANDIATLHAALGADYSEAIARIRARECDLSVQLLAGSFSQYQRASQRWWSSIEPIYLQKSHPRRRPVYIVSSNTHSLVNLFGGYARTHRDAIVDFARRKNPENLAPTLDAALAAGDEDAISNLSYYLLRAFITESGGDRDERSKHVRAFDAESGIQFIESPGYIDVDAQLFELRSLKRDRLDPRVIVPGIEAIEKSDAVILNVDYPLGLAAYHHLQRIAQGVGEIRGIYVMGKAATLNGRVGDIMISSVVHDEHSRNTILFRNCFSARDVQPFLREATVLDNQKALTVRSAFLQNREYMGAFYRDAYTVLEMEAGPYLSVIYELVYPSRHPNNEIVNLTTATPFDLGVLHYASDTPYSRRQSLLSKSLSYFGVESTLACACAIAQRILRTELAQMQRVSWVPSPNAP